MQNTEKQNDISISVFGFEDKTLYRNIFQNKLF